MKLRKTLVPGRYAIWVDTGAGGAVVGFVDPAPGGYAARSLRTGEVTRQHRTMTGAAARLVAALADGYYARRPE